MLLPISHKSLVSEVAYSDAKISRKKLRNSFLFKKNRSLAKSKLASVHHSIVIVSSPSKPRAWVAWGLLGVQPQAYSSNPEQPPGFDLTPDYGVCAEPDRATAGLP